MIQALKMDDLSADELLSLIVELDALRDTAETLLLDRMRSARPPSPTELLTD